MNSKSIWGRASVIGRRDGYPPLLLVVLLWLSCPVAVLAAPDPHTGLGANGVAKVALQHYQAGRIDEALTVLAEGIDRYPLEPTLRVVRAGILSEQQQPEAALHELDAANQLAPNNPMILTNRAQLYRGAGRLDDALADLDRAVAVAPDYFAARYNRGSLRFERGDYDGALVDFDRCIAVDPHMSPAYFNRANVQAALGNYSASVTDIDRFVDISDDPEWIDRAQRSRVQWMAKQGGLEQTD